MNCRKIGNEVHFVWKTAGKSIVGMYYLYICESEIILRDRTKIDRIRESLQMASECGLAAVFIGGAFRWLIAESSIVSRIFAGLFIIWGFFAIAWMALLFISACGLVGLKRSELELLIKKGSAFVFNSKRIKEAVVRRSTSREIDLELDFEDGILNIEMSRKQARMLPCELSSIVNTSFISPIDRS